jgi:hypothetical protein
MAYRWLCHLLRQHHHQSRLQLLLDVNSTHSIKENEPACAANVSLSKPSRHDHCKRRRRTLIVTEHLPYTFVAEP